MKPTTTAKIGIGLIGAGIIGYGLYSMKKDTEKLFNAPGNFIDGLFGPDSVLGGSGLPKVDTEIIRQAGSTAKSSFIDGLVDGLSTSLGLGLPPSAASHKLEKSSSIKPTDTIFDIKKSLDLNIPMTGALPKTGNLPIVPTSSIKPADTILDVKKSLDLNIPMTGASPVTKYTEKSSSSSSSSYTDSTGREYTPTNVIKAKW